MTMRLSDLAAIIRSKNAGPFVLTFDILFDSDENYRRVKGSGVLSPEIFAKLYPVAPDQVKFFACDSARAFKFSIPQTAVQGSLGAADLHGGQQFAPLIDIEIPD
jgi:Domain of unknown function (DUF4387)